MISKFRSKRALAVAAIVIARCTTEIASAQARIEIHPVETATFSTQQFLVGSNTGRPTTLAAELRIPTLGPGKLPAVILVHGSAGLVAYHARWAHELNSIGVAALLLDSFTGRGITSTATDQSQLDSLAMMVDAYRALGMLAQHPRIDASRIAVMGFSKGAVAAVYSSSDRFRKMHGPSNVQFAAHIGLYTPCYTMYRDDDKVTAKPIRLFHGIADDWVPIGPCRAYVRRLRDARVDVALTEYVGAHHTYDNFLLNEKPEPFGDGQIVGNCQLVEGDQGSILNSKTGRPFYFNDECVERGAHLAYDEAATVSTVKAVKEFLATVFKLEVQTLH